jgi:aminopeptidase
MHEIAKRIFDECLNLKNEQVLIISDNGVNSQRIGASYKEAAQNMDKEVIQVMQNPQTELSKASPEVVNALQKLEKNNIVILAVSNKLGSLGGIGKSFRRFCQQRKHRFVSATSLGSIPLDKFEVLERTMDVNYLKMQLHGLWLKKQIDSAAEIRITTSAGTDISFDVFGMQSIANTGNYSQPGSGGNIPAGEVYVPPRGIHNVRGRFVIDGSMRTDRRTILLKEPVEVKVENGRIISIEGPDASLLEDSLRRAEKRSKYPERIRIIGELGFGINPNAKLVGATIIDEKVQNTAHIAIGSNYWFGGSNRTLFHADQVFKDPKVFIDGKEINIIKN